MTDNATDLSAVMARLDALERENAALRAGNEPAKPKPAPKKTGSDTHRATARGHALGELIEPGEMVPAGVPISENWMEPVKKGDRALAGAMQEAQADHPGDADLTQVGLPGLKAMAAERGINPKGLSEDDLIAAIKAEREPTI